VLKLMNETTSTALAYGIYKQDLPPPEEKARNVVFVDVGHIGVQAAACSFNKGKLSVKACTFDRGCGGKSYDAKLAKYFAEDFKAKHKMDPCSVPRVYLKLVTEVEKIKKQMSANTNNLPLNIECFMEERDLSGRVDRVKFEELIAPEIARIEAVLQECLAVSEWKLEDIYSVEVVGGSTRIPAIKSAIERVFGKVPNTTLNADEAVSRGCALQCAILSPTFKVREFSVTDIQPFEIKLSWEAETDKGDMVVFPKFHQIPFSKLLTFYRRDNFTVEASYGSDVPVQNPFIGRFEIGEVKPLVDGGNQKVKVKVRVNLNGVFTVSSASLIEKQEIEEEVSSKFISNCNVFFK
jgi:molecular chaperone DnaK (HSP70)